MTELASGAPVIIADTLEAAAPHVRAAAKKPLNPNKTIRAFGGFLRAAWRPANKPCRCGSSLADQAETLPCTEGGVIS
jgi:hypothetical protein